MTTMTAETTEKSQAADESYRERVDTAVKALSNHGVSEDRIREMARLTPEEWAQFKQSSAGITPVELAHFSGALFLEPIYLLTGDDRNAILFAPCALASITKSVYPEAEVQL